jgi:DNA helicase II / ATP-dependent DNA helicase PcrA
LFLGHFKILQIRGEVLFYFVKNLVTLGLKNLQNAHLKKDVVAKCLEHIAIEEEMHQKTCPNKVQKVIQMVFNQLKPFQQKSLEKKLLWLKNFKKYTPHQAIQTIRKGEAFEYDKYLEMNKRKSLTFHKEMIVEMLNELEISARKHQTILDYLNFIDKSIQWKEKMNHLRQTDADVVKLMTIHQAKGLEFDTVFLIGVIENILPHKAALNAEEQEDRIPSKKAKEKNISKFDEAIEEERRLCYVAITRAKESLYLSAPQKHHNNKANESRFILEALSTKHPTNVTSSHHLR